MNSDQRSPAHFGEDAAFMSYLENGADGSWRLDSYERITTYWQFWQAGYLRGRRDSSEGAPVYVEREEPALDAKPSRRQGARPPGRGRHRLTTFGRLVQSRRIELGHTMDELALKIGAGRQHLWRALTAQAELNYGQFLLLAKALNEPVPTLYQLYDASLPETAKRQWKLDAEGNAL